MISIKNRDMNRSRDVAGPKLERSYEGENPMKEGLFKDSAPTGTISKEPLSSLHDGDHHAPLTATGMQEVVSSQPMGQDHADHVPSVKKGSYPKGMGRSIAKKMQYAEKKKAG